MVTSINGNNVTWRDSKTGNLITDVHQDLEIVMRKGGKTRRKKQSGGYLRGPSHAQGGIPATFQNGGAPVELEGGEYIINAQTVNALGTPFLDELNSTQTSYHQGGFQQGQLPSPSQYGNGGKIRKKQYGGGVSNNNNQCIRHRMPDGTEMNGPPHGAGQTCIEWSTGSNNMRRGGRPTRKRKGGSARPAKAMRKGGSARPARGRNTRRMQPGGHVHPINTEQKTYLKNIGLTHIHPDGTGTGLGIGSGDYESTLTNNYNASQTDNGPHQHPVRPRQQSTRRNGGSSRTMRRGGRPTTRRMQNGGQTLSGYYMNGVPYNGLVLTMNGIAYSTKSGAMEGTSVPLTIGKP